ncbi:MAG: thiamine pyrophosphate-binding protein [Anaerolineae bacterium]|nr:thiamine pyrophosphate-binding protein [Anaerolineae bacterium]
MNAADAIVAMLKAYQVRFIFGIPGDTSITLYESLRTAGDSLTHVLARDERGAAFMADVYARLSGKPGFCEAPSGAGATYLVPGLAEANFSSIPVIGFTTDIPLEAEGRNVLTELDQNTVFKAVTKWNTTLRRANKVPEVMRKAFREATTGRAGAVQITLPEDVLHEEYTGSDSALFAQEECSRYPALRTMPDPAAVEEAARLLLRARQPVLVAGGGAAISGAWAEVTELAELLLVPVGTSINGQGSIDEAHPLSIGVVGGNGARPYANEILMQADLVLYVGCKTDSVTTQNWTMPPNNGRVTILHIDVDPLEIGNTYPTAVGMVGDARLALAELIRVLKTRLRADGDEHEREYWADFAGLRQRWFSSQEEAARSDSRPIKPQRIFSIMSRLLPRESVIVADPGTATPFTSAMVLSPAGRHIIIPRAFGGLGYAIPGVVGAKLARPNAPVIGLVGDGSFGMAAGDLETIARLGLPVVLVQFSNAEFGWIKTLQHLYQEERYFSVDFSTDTDYAGIARGFGMHGVHVENPGDFEAVFQAALKSDRPTFINVVSESEVTETPPVHKWQQTVAARGMRS